MELLCIQCWPTEIIVAAINMGGIFVSSLISVILVFCKLKKKKENEFKRQKHDLIETLSAELYANFDAVIRAYQLFNEIREKDIQKDNCEEWYKFNLQITPYLLAACKIKNKAEVLIKDDKLLNLISQTEIQFIDVVRMLNRGEDPNSDEKNSLNSYNEKKQEVITEMRKYLKTLEK